MKRREPALARVHPAAGERRAARERAHRGLRDRPEAHSADVHDRSREERLLAEALADRERRGGQPVLLEHRIGMIDEQDRAWLVGVVGRAEADHPALSLGEAVHPAARGAVEGQLFPVVQEEVLPEVLALLLQEITQVPDDRIVAQDGVLLLSDVLDEYDYQKCDQNETDDGPETVRDDTQHARHAPNDRRKRPAAMSVTAKIRSSSLPPAAPSKRIPVSSVSGKRLRGSTRRRFSS